MGETWYQTTNSDFKPDKIIYKADDWEFTQQRYSRWRPSIHMPRWASRIDLEILDVRVQRLFEISDEDIVAEGCQLSNDKRELFINIWNEVYTGKGFPWLANPWVWVIEFKRIKP
jgi:hypothetical protein